jgi:Tfp pilus assembly protein PilZ
MAFVDRRRHGRYVVMEEILIVVDSKTAVDSGTLVNVGESGCYVATQATLHPGERVSLLVHIPEGKGYSIRLGCMVAWHNTGQVSSAREGYGLEFLYGPRTRRDAQKLLAVLKARNALVALVP